MSNKRTKLLGLFTALFLLLTTIGVADDVKEPDAPKEPGTQRSEVPEQTEADLKRQAEELRQQQRMREEIKRQREREDLSDAPLITIRGKVLLPDGSPAKDLQIDMHCMPHQMNFAPRTVDEQGEYSCDLPLGTWMVARVLNPNNPVDGNGERLVSSIISNIVTENPVAEHYDIHLQQGIRVTGTLRYEDGTPAVKKSVRLKEYELKRPDDPKRGGMISYSHHHTDEDGRYTVWVRPNKEHELAPLDCPDDAMPLQLPEHQQEFTVDFVLPMPTVLRFVLPDGTTATDVVVVVVSGQDGRHSVGHPDRFQPELDGSFRAVLSQRIAYLISAKTSDDKFGKHHFILANEILGTEIPNPITLTLEPPVTCKVKVAELKSGAPIANHTLNYYPQKRIHNTWTLSGFSMDTRGAAWTEDDGVATLPLFVGAEYAVYSSDGGGVSRLEITPEQSGEIMERTLTIALPEAEE